MPSSKTNGLTETRGQTNWHMTVTGKGISVILKFYLIPFSLSLSLSLSLCVCVCVSLSLIHVTTILIGLSLYELQSFHFLFRTLHRISLTFREVATWMDATTSSLYGQGAVCLSKSEVLMLNILLPLSLSFAPLPLLSIPLSSSLRKYT